MGRKPSVALLGAGKLASFLAPALVQAGYRVTEIVARGSGESLKRARALARLVGARTATAASAQLNATLLWFAVPDAEIRPAAESVLEALAGRARLAHAPTSVPRLAFHSSGALASEELGALQKAGIAVASVHPLMTFVARSKPSLAGVPFAVEGDRAAVRTARGIVRELGGRSFTLAARLKPAYHAWATMTSPLLLAYLVAVEKVAGAAGLTQEEARRMSLPIMRQTLENYARLGPADSFSGPFIRGDAATVEKHLALLERNPKVGAVYVALARVALHGLPVRNQKKLLGLVEGLL